MRERAVRRGPGAAWIGLDWLGDADVFQLVCLGPALYNGTSGIAVGLATNLPPHNLGEVVKACVMLIENPEATTAQLLDRVKGPDFPLGGKIVTDRTALRQIYEEGTGSIKVQGEWKLEEHGRREQIVITSIPYGVNKGSLEEVIGEIIETRKLPQLLSLVNESNEKDGIRVVMEIKAGTDPNLVMAYLYKHTALQENFAYNLTCLVPSADGRLRPERLGLQAILRHFLDFRLATVRRRFEFDLELSSPALHERNHARSHDDKNDDDGKRFKGPCAQKLKHG